ncbi:MAG TPA: CHAD domain-containing protein [Anaerolineales bacterium]|nr:CHAD domain-containing protein [Anaerolineales bacterium]HNN12031.1 CHAD domain-containing protein [Anaerolineales bacterium]HNO30743.1 CHAD domain-containing protein [Anaerolineales bacterium]
MTTMDAKAILLEALDERWRKFRIQRKACRAEFSAEAVHDLPVSTRRLLAVFDLLSSLFTHKRIQKVRRELKDQLDDLDSLRDTQVLLADISEFILEVPELRSFQERLRKNEISLLRRTRALIKSHKVGKLGERLEKIREMIAVLPDQTIGAQLPAAADLRFARVLETYAAMDTENIPSIHKLRVAFKKFRYTVEIIQPLLENFPTENFKQMHDYQSMMGDIQDLEVASEQWADFKDRASLSNPELVTDHYASRLRTAVMNFIEDKAEVLTFWRNRPEEPFPWEKPV